MPKQPHLLTLAPPRLVVLRHSPRYHCSHKATVRCRASLTHTPFAFFFDGLEAIYLSTHFRVLQYVIFFVIGNFVPYPSLLNRFSFSTAKPFAFCMLTYSFNCSSRVRMWGRSSSLLALSFFRLRIRFRPPNPLPLARLPPIQIIRIRVICAELQWNAYGTPWPVRHPSL